LLPHHTHATRDMRTDAFWARTLTTGLVLLGSVMIAGSLFSNESPHCAPSRDAVTTARRPEWLAQTFDAAGIPASIKRSRPWWADELPWRSRETPTSAFELTRQVGKMVTFCAVAGVGVIGAFTMPTHHVLQLCGAMTAVILGTCSIICMLLNSGTGDGLIEALVLLVFVAGAGMVAASAGLLMMAVPLIWGLVGTYALVLEAARSTEAPIDSSIQNEPREAMPVSGHLHEKTADQIMGDQGDADQIMAQIELSDDTGGTDAEASSSESECDFRGERALYVM